MFIDASMADLASRILDANAGVDVHICVGGDLPGWRSYEDALASAGDAPPVSDGSEMLYSSGTTGRPKAVRRPLPEDGKGSWAQKVLEYSLTQRYGMTESSVYLSPAPLYHAAGVNYTMAAQRVGAAAIVMPRFDAEDSLRLIEKHRVTHAQFVPTMFVRMLKLPDAVRESYDVSSLECVIHAAAPCPVDVKHRMMKWFGPIIHEYYGGTEGFAGTTIDPQEWLAHPGSVGKPLTAVHVVGDDGTECAVGESGELYFEGGPAFEYFKDPEKTASVSNEHGWRSLGDMGYVDEDGYLYLTDRSTFMIVSGGVNIYPQEAENLLVMHPKLVDAAVFGVPERGIRRGGQGRRATGGRRGRRTRTRGRTHRVLPGAPGRLQMSADSRIRSRPAPGSRTASSTRGVFASAIGRGGRHGLSDCPRTFLTARIFGGISSGKERSALIGPAVLGAPRFAHPQLTVPRRRAFRGQLTLEHLVCRGGRQIGGDPDIPRPRLRRQIGLLCQECLEALGSQASTPSCNTTAAMI